MSFKVDDIDLNDCDIAPEALVKRCLLSYR